MHILLYDWFFCMPGRMVAACVSESYVSDCYCVTCCRMLELRGCMTEWMNGEIVCEMAKNKVSHKQEQQSFTVVRTVRQDVRTISWPWNVGYRSLKVIKNGTIWKLGYGFLFAFYSNHGFILAVCDIFNGWPDLENRVRVRSRSLEMAPFNRLHTSLNT